MPSIRGALAAAAAVCTLPLLPLAPLAPLAAQVLVPAPVQMAGSAFSITPHVGFTTYTDLAEISVRDASDPSFGTIEITGKAKLQGQFTFGVTGAYQPAASRWGAFGDFARSSGDARIAARICFDDPSDGRTCESGSVDAKGSQWRLAAGVTRRSALGAAVATLSLGALYGKTHFETEDPDTGEKTETSGSNPGALLGAALEFPLAPRVGIRMHLNDAIMRISDKSIGAVSGEVPAGITVKNDPKIANALSFGAGLVLRF